MKYKRSENYLKKNRDDRIFIYFLRDNSVWTKWRNESYGIGKHYRWHSGSQIFNSNSLSTQQVVKITSVYCNTSKIILDCLNCSLIDISKTHSYLSFVAITKKPVYNFRIDVSIFSKLKREKEFKRLLFFPKIDACSFTDQIDSKYSVLKSQIYFINQTVNGEIHKCPYTKFEVANFNLSLNGDEKLEHFNLPNGMIKTIIQVYNNRDRNILFIEMDVLKNIVKNNNWSKLSLHVHVYELIWCVNKSVINSHYTRENNKKITIQINTHPASTQSPTLFSQLNLNLPSSSQRWWLLIQRWDASRRDKMFSKHTKINLRKNSFNWNERSQHHPHPSRVESLSCTL